MKNNTSLLRVACATLLSIGTVGAAHAGGFARGTADTDLLFEEGNFNMRVGATIVVPSQKFSVNVNPALVGTQVYDTYVVPSGAFKFDISENFRCAGTYTQNTGASQNYAAPKFPSGKVLEEFTTDEFGATCDVRFDAGPGIVSVLAGGFVEQLNYERVTSLVGLGFPAGTTADLILKGQEYGWRAGLAYEMPEYALRAQIMYRSGTEYGAAGEIVVPGALVGAPLPSLTLPAIGEGNLPQSVEVKVQTGIAPGWLAFGQVRWMDWSVLQTLAVTAAPLPPVLDQYQWQDGWTVTGGVGHAFNDTYAARASLTWDRGVSTGWDLRDDVWTFAIGGSAKDKIGGEFRGAIGISYISAVEETQYLNAIVPGNIHSGFNQAADSGYAVSFNAGYALQW